MKSYLPFIVIAAAAIATADPVSHGGPPFRSIKATKEIIENYEVVMPVVSMKDRQLPYPQSLKITVPTQSKNYSLILHMNQHAISSGFTSIYFDQQGRMVRDKVWESHSTPYPNCYYHGTVEGYPDWTVLMTTCQGLQGEFGARGTKENYYHLEPLDQNNPSMNQLHAFYKDSEYRIQPGSCGSKGHHTKNDRVVPETEDVLNNTHNARVRRQTSNRFVEWVVVNDDTQYTAYGRNLSNTVQRAISIANGMDPLYRRLTPSIRITLTGAITFTNGNRFTLSSDSDTLINQFQSYVTSSLTSQDRDSIMLLTGIDLIGDTVGIAFVNTMCKKRSSVGLSQDGGRSLGSVVATAAHELGHILNMGHDDDHEKKGETCACPQDYCIMAAVSRSNPPISFSSCSLSDVGDLITRNGDFCLFNTPTTPVEGERCGNGIREGNEACDCGDIVECTDPCCNSRTCQLVTGAQCSAGQCCNNQCRFKPQGSLCRAKSGECDIADSCTGASGECPQDIYVVDGTPCASNTGYCVGRRCSTHRAQCLEAWNSAAAATSCYNSNTRGDQFGNCGHTSSAYLSCSSSDVRCGQLQCSDGTYQDIYKVAGTLLTLTIGRDICKSFSVGISSEEPNPGLVALGTKCGNGRLCLSQRRCVPVSNLNAPTCPIGSNGLTCSGTSRGICNNLGRCSCSDGFSGSTCEAHECATRNGGCQQVCTNTQGSFVCSCNAGYVPSLNFCIDVNECLNSKGGCSQNCENSEGSFKCSCRTGYQLSGTTNCVDIDECSRPNNGGCDMACINSEGSYSCNCNSGYFLDTDGKGCTNINECSASNGGCTHNCLDQDGSFVCSCYLGFSLNRDQLTCSAINPCTQAEDNCEQFCSKFGTSVICSCRNGYTLGDNRRSCIDINECETNNGGCSQICSNSFGSFSCNCNPGYTLDGNGHTCNDVNECLFDNGGCDQVCNNVQGSMTCTCREGFVFGSDGRTCGDVDECSQQTGQSCQQICTNEIGSFKCDCNSGYALADDGRTCVDIDECATDNGDCTHSCKNSEGSFLCDCDFGYVLDTNGFSCNDIDECLRGDNGGCDQVCVNLPIGSNSCNCRESFNLQQDGVSCAAANVCQDLSRCNQYCLRVGTQDICSCRAGYILDTDGRTCIDVDQCDDAKSNNCEEKCVNLDGGYFCTCRTPGTELSADGITCINITFTGDENTGTNNNGGAIAGGVIGGILTLLVVVFVIALVVFLVWRRHTKKGISSTNTSASYKNPPASNKSTSISYSYKTASTNKAGSAEDLLSVKNDMGKKPTELNDESDSDNSFEDTLPAVYDNVTYDMETDTHIPLKKMPPTRPFQGNKNLPPSHAPAELLAPVRGAPPPVIKPTGQSSAPVTKPLPFKPSASTPPSSTSKSNPPAVMPIPSSTKPTPSVPALKPVKSKPTPVPPAKFSDQANNHKPLPPSKPTGSTEQQAPPAAPLRSPKPASKPTTPTPASKPTVPTPASKPTAPTPASKPTAPTPASKPTVPTPASKPTVPTPASKPTAPKPSSKPVMPEAKKRFMAPPHK